MRIEITLKNYRCFADRHPARIVIEDGLIAFVGVNNAGKSSLLRFLFEFRRFFQHFQAGGHWSAGTDGSPRGIGFPPPVRDAIEVYTDSNERPLTVRIRVAVEPGSPPASAPDAEVVEFQSRRDERGNFRLTSIALPGGGQFPLTKPSGMEMPDWVLRQGPETISLRNHIGAIHQLSRTLYVGAFRNVLNTGSNQDYFDIQVGDAFIRRWRGMQTGNTKHENHACLKVEKMVARLLGYNALSIQAADSNDTLQIVANGQPYKLHELGSGIAQCILVLVNAAVAKPGYILIDEPELDLHPSLQLDFLTALADFAEYGTLFSTHSIGLARAAAQRIYSVTRQDGFSQVKELEELQNLPEFLGSLSYSSYHALGFDKVLLVEGTTEVLAIQRLLRKLGKDHRVLLLPLGGSSMINGSREPELNEIKRITPNVSALIDSELVSSNDSLAPDRAAFLTACGKLGITCRVLERRALENYLTDAAIKQVKGPKFRALTKFEKLTDVKPFWGKNENWRIIGEMSWDDVKATDLGQFLESL